MHYGHIILIAIVYIGLYVIYYSRMIWDYIVIGWSFIKSYIVGILFFKKSTLSNDIVENYMDLL
jgi:hypothetical protein